MVGEPCLAFGPRVFWSKEHVFDALRQKPRINKASWGDTGNGWVSPDWPSFPILEQKTRF